MSGKGSGSTDKPSAYSVLTMIRPVAELVIILAEDRMKQHTYNSPGLVERLREHIKKIRRTLGIKEGS